MENISRLQKRKYFIVGSFLAFAAMGITIFGFSQRYSGSATLVIESQPVKVPPHIHRPGFDRVYDHASITEGILTVPEDIWIESFEAEVIGAPDKLLHHATIALYENTFYRRPSDLPCPHVRESIWAIDNFNQRKTYTMPKPYGFFIPKGEKINLWSMLHNTSGVEYENVSVRVTVRGKFGVTSDGQHKAIRSYHLSTEECIGIGIFTVPPRTENFVRNIQYDPFIIPEDGEIVQLAPHFHYWDGAKLEVVLLNGKELWRFYPPEGGPIPFRLDPANKKFPYPVKKDDRLGFYVVYDNPKDVPITDAMGMVIFSLHSQQ